jgi:hypothetical protein
MTDTVADDLLRGAAEIAAFIGETQKRVYYLAAHGHLDIGHLGATLIASKRRLREQYQQLIQARPAEPPPPPKPVLHRPPPRRGRRRKRPEELTAEAGS